MKVAILGRYPLDTQRLGGGVEAAIIYAQRELLKLPNVELHFITCTERLSQVKRAEGEGFTITYLPRRRYGRITGHRAEVRAMISVLGEIKPDVVHAHSAGLYAGAALASGYPTVVTVHGIFWRESKLLTGWPARLRGFLDSQYERSIIRRAQHLITITPYVEKAFEGVFSGNSYLVENACDARFFDIVRQPVLGRLLFAGYVVPRKGVLPLIRALRLVRDQIPEAHLRIAGSLAINPAYAQACQRCVRELDLEDSVAFLGQLPQGQMLQEYASCTAFVLPSFQETAPVAIEQAMAAGVPSVATRAGGIPWMLEDGVTGLTLPLPRFPEGDPVALSQALLRLLRDTGGAGRMGRRAKDEADRRFRAEIVARRTWEVYQQVIEASR